MLLPLEELKSKLTKYDKIHFLGNIIGSKVWYPKAEIVAGLALEEIRNKRFVSPQDLEPLYLYSRECDIKGK